MRKDAITLQVLDEDDQEFFSVEVKIQGNSCITRYEDLLPMDINSSSSEDEELRSVMEMLPSDRTHSKMLTAPSDGFSSSQANRFYSAGMSEKNEQVGGKLTKSELGY